MTLLPTSADYDLKEIGSGSLDSANQIENGAAELECRFGTLGSR
jgi:hypothetical protein